MVNQRKPLLALGLLLPEFSQRVSGQKQEPKAKSGVALHSYVLRRLLKQLAAILIGNAIYFLLLTPHLPPAAQHQPDRSISACWSISGFAWWSTASSS